MKNQKRRIFAFICIMTMIVTLCYTPTTFAATTKSFKTSGKTIVPIVKKGKDISKNKMLIEWDTNGKDIIKEV